MAGFPMKRRQAIIDGYLAATGKNLFLPAEFVDWLAERPEHEAHEWFFGTDDASAAREHRIALARRMASGLRLTAKVSQAPAASAAVSVAVREFPALVSPVAGRRHGGGYEPFHPTNPELALELQRQGGVALLSWLARYRGVAELAGVDVDPIEKIADRLTNGVVSAA